MTRFINLKGEVGIKKKKKKKGTGSAYSRRFLPRYSRGDERVAYLEVALEDLQRGEFRPAACAPRR